MADPFVLGAYADDFYGAIGDDVPDATQVQLPAQATAVPAVTAAQAIQRQVEQERYFNRLRRTAANRIRSLSDGLNDARKRVKILVGGSLLLTAIAGGIGYWLGRRSVEKRGGAKPAE